MRIVILLIIAVGVGYVYGRNEKLLEKTKDIILNVIITIKDFVRTIINRIKNR